MTQTNHLEVSEAEIVAAGNSWHQAVAVKQQRLNREAAEAVRNNPAASETD